MTIQSIASQEVIERFCEKVIAARQHFASEHPTQRHRRERTSPYDHYYIATYSRATYDLTSWLGGLGDDPAIEVSHSCFSSLELAKVLCRILYLDSRTIYLPAFVTLHTMATNTTSLTKIVILSFSPTTKSLSTAFCASITPLMTCDASKIPSILVLGLILWCSLMKMSVHTHTGMLVSSKFSM